MKNFESAAPQFTVCHAGRRTVLASLLAVVDALQL